MDKKIIQGHDHFQFKTFRKRSLETAGNLSGKLFKLKNPEKALRRNFKRFS